MNDLTKLCDELEECRKKKSCYADEIVCTKAKLNAYIQGKSNKILKLKAQIKMHNDYKVGEFEGITFILATVSFGFMVIDSITGGSLVNVTGAGLVGLIVIALINGIDLWGSKKYGYRKKWIKYIEVVLEEMEK